MTYQQGVRIAGRVIAIYFLFWIVSDLLSLPHEAMTIKHYWQEASQTRATIANGLESLATYLLRSSILSMAENVLKILLWAMGATYFYRGGPWLQRFFGPDEQDENSLRAGADASKI